MKSFHIKRIAAAILAITFAIIFWTGRQAQSEDIDAWVMCKPGDLINLRANPSKKSAEAGFAISGDHFTTDGKIKNNFLHVLDLGDCDCWIYAGYVVFEEPEPVFENYVCVSKKRAACRRWIDGPLVKGPRGWIYTGDQVSVFYIADDWAMTSRGYIKAEWLEVDPQ